MIMGWREKTMQAFVDIINYYIGDIISYYSGDMGITNYHTIGPIHICRETTTGRAPAAG